MNTYKSILFSLPIIALFAFGTSCALIRKKQFPETTEIVTEKDSKLAKLAIEMLNPESDRYDPERARNVLEYSATHGGLKTLNIPTATLLALLREESAALNKNEVLEQQLQVLKEIDIGHAERSMEKEKL